MDETYRRPAAVAFFGVLFLFFLQSLSVLIQSVYILDLMNLELDAKAAALLFLFSPILLLFKGRKSGIWIGASLGLLLASRLVFPFLDTGGRLVGSGIAAGSSLALIVLAWGAFLRPGSEVDEALPSQGLALALALSTALRALGRGLDPSMEAALPGMGTGLCLALRLALAIALVAAFTALALERRKLEAEGEVPLPRGLGILSLLALAWFAFANPGVIARWIEVDDLVPMGAVSLLSIAWIVALAIRPSWPRELGRPLLAAWNALFAIALAGLAATGTPRFPASPEAPALVVGPPGALRVVLLGLTLVLMPVIYADLARLTTRSAPATPKTARRTALSFTAGSLWLCLLAFMNIFTNVWAYVAPVSSLFRGLYWLPLALAAALPGILAVAAKRPAPAGAVSVNAPRAAGPAAGAPPTGRKPMAMAAAALAALLIVVTAAATSVRPRPPALPSGRDFVRVASYNIQAGADGEARRVHAEQLELIRSLDPDIVALQESDTARISLGNDDLVRFYAEGLGYHSFYGPSVAAGTFGTAILSRYPLEGAEVFYTYSDEDEVGTSRASFAALGRRWAIFCVHPAGSEDVDLAFAKALVERAGREERAIVAGDFNMRRGQSGYDAVASSMRNAWSVLHPDADPLDPNRRWIDHVFLSPGLRVRDAGYVMPPGSYSDHPVHWADIVP